jgi:hypothetical protein
MQNEVLNNFFEKIINGYLFLDLRNMSLIEEAPGETGGGLGYPMLATVVSGMELLGGILQTEKPYNDSSRNSQGYFNHFWFTYLVPYKKEYAEYNEIVWKLVRHGVAHTYIAKAAITVTKGNKTAHLLTHGTNQLNIDCKEFYEDFLGSYKKLVEPKIFNDSAFSSLVATNIKTMLKESEDVSRDILQKTRLSKLILKNTTPSGIATASTTTVPMSDIAESIELSTTPLSAFGKNPGDNN